MIIMDLYCLIDDYFIDWITPHHLIWYWPLPLNHKSLENGPNQTVRAQSIFFVGPQKQYWKDLWFDQIGWSRSISDHVHLVSVPGLGEENLWKFICLSWACGCRWYRYGHHGWTAPTLGFLMTWNGKCSCFKIYCFWFDIYTKYS
jgi:hypothetical protein